jgi:hypothetical protein
MIKVAVVFLLILLLAGVAIGIIARPRPLESDM